MIALLIELTFWSAVGVLGFCLGMLALREMAYRFFDL